MDHQEIEVAQAKHQQKVETRMHEEQHKREAIEKKELQVIIGTSGKIAR